LSSSRRQPPGTFDATLRAESDAIVVYVSYRGQMSATDSK